MSLRLLEYREVVKINILYMLFLNRKSFISGFSCAALYLAVNQSYAVNKKNNFWI